jgi:1,4-alpha-glucan branching enzyme
VWLNEKNAWIQPHLRVAETRLTELVQQFDGAEGVEGRALRQAARELLLAQASDWPFILTTGTSPEYARQRVTDHLTRFQRLHDGLTTGTVDAAWLGEIEACDSVFPGVDPRDWRPAGGNV